MKTVQGCPGSQMFQFKNKTNTEGDQEVANIPSQLRQWPIQLHLVSPTAPFYQGADVLLTADCVGYALGNFHQDFLKGKSLAIACPKLDEGQDVCQEKIKAWVEEARINTLTVLIMQVPCCMGLLNLTRQAVAACQRKVPLKYVVVGVEGAILKEEWV